MCCEESGKKLKSLWITNHMLNPHKALSFLPGEPPDSSSGCSSYFTYNSDKFVFDFQA